MERDIDGDRRWKLPRLLHKRVADLSAIARKAAKKAQRAKERADSGKRSWFQRLKFWEKNEVRQVAEEDEDEEDESEEDESEDLGVDTSDPFGALLEALDDMDITQMFHEVDTDGSGSITVDELHDRSINEVDDGAD